MVKDEASPSKGNAYLQRVVSIMWWFAYWDAEVWQRDSLSLNEIKIEMEYIRIWKWFTIGILFIGRVWKDFSRGAFGWKILY